VYEVLKKIKSSHRIWSLFSRHVADEAVYAVAGESIHPCVINNRNTLVYPSDLAVRNPDFYAQLQSFARLEGYDLLSDRRQADVSVAVDRRRPWLPVFVLSLGLSSGLAANEQELNEKLAAQTTLSLFNAANTQFVQTVDESAQPRFEVIENQVDKTDVQGLDVADSLAITSDSSKEIELILRQHYASSAGDPDYIESDLRAMADYFSRYPEAVALLTALKGHSWRLAYLKDTFETEVRGNAIQVKSVKVNFDPRAAAQLRSHRACKETEKRGACIASPADALLHELLHAKSALLQSEQFIEQGGMSSVMYPFAHENSVITSENALYKAMTAIDSHYRPSRHAHAGRVIASACVTCLN
jgi:hypothetical protein